MTTILTANDRQLAQIAQAKASWHTNIDLPDGRVLACGLCHPTHAAADFARARINAEHARAAAKHLIDTTPDVGWTHDGKTIISTRPHEGQMIGTCLSFAGAPTAPGEPRQYALTLTDIVMDRDDPKLRPGAETGTRIGLICAWAADTRNDIGHPDAVHILNAIPDLLGRRWAQNPIPALWTDNTQITAAGGINIASLLTIGMTIYTQHDSEMLDHDEARTLRINGGVIIGASNEPTGRTWAVIRWGIGGLQIGHVHETELHTCPAGTSPCFYCPQPPKRIKSLRRKLFKAAAKRTTRNTVSDEAIRLLHAEKALRK